MKTEMQTPRIGRELSDLIPPSLQVQVFTEQGEAALAGYIAECEARWPGEAPVLDEPQISRVARDRSAVSTSAVG